MYKENCNNNLQLHKATAVTSSKATDFSKG